MAYLFDTNAVSEVFRPRPNREYSDWLKHLPREEQLTSTVVLYELYTAAFRAPNSARWRRRIEEVVLPSLTVLPFDLACSKECGRLQALLTRRGQPIGTADVQIAATARVHQLILVTANKSHFSRIADLSLRVFTPGDSR